MYRKGIKKAVARVSELQVMNFRNNCKDFLHKASKKLLDKCPLKYTLVNNLSSLDPQQMANDTEAYRNKFRKVVNTLNIAKKIKDSDMDKVYEEYSSLLNQVPLIGTHNFTGFSRSRQSIDKFLMGVLDEEKYPALRSFVKVVLVICHGQADVERGFSINKEVEVENLKQNSIIAQRTICDYVNHVGGIMKVDITPQLMSSVSSASSKYTAYLDKQREIKLTAEKKLKRKHELDAIDELKKKKARLQEDIEGLEIKSEKLLEKAEVTGKISFVTESNVLRSFRN